MIPIFRFITLLFSAFICLTISGCNTTDTGVSQPFPDCFDKMQNQGETGVDCGGPCLQCDAQISANIDGAPYHSVGSVTSTTIINSIILLSANGTSNLSLIHTGSFETGTYPLQSALYTISATGTNYTSDQGTIRFVQWDHINHLVSGTFNFMAVEASGTGDTLYATNGIFLNVHYNP